MFFVSLSQAPQLTIQHANFAGPFKNQKDAQTYATSANQKYAQRGIPQWVASFHVTK
jgi:hypothetical protein